MTQQYSLQQFLSIPSSHGASVSASGHKIAYLNNQTGIDQVYIHDGSINAEPGQVTHGTEAIEFVSFSPRDENLLLYGSSAGGNEKTQFFMLRLNDQAIPLTRGASPTRNFGHWAKNGHSFSFASNERNGIDFDVYIMDIETFSSTAVFSLGGWCSSSGFSPCGNFLVVKKSVSNALSNLYVIDLAAENAVIDLPGTGKDAQYLSIQWKPDSSGFYFVSDFESDVKTVRFYEISSAVTTVVVALDGEVEDIALSHDDAVMAVTSSLEGYNTVFLYNTNNFSQPRAAYDSNGYAGAPQFSSDNRTLLFEFCDYKSSLNVRCWNLDTGNQTSVVPMQHQIPDEVFAKPSLIQVKSFDGLEIPAFVFTPPDTSPEELPAIIYIHGGPEGQFRPSFNPLIQFFVQHGFVVVGPNVRGSAGYGKRYLALDDVEKRMDSVADLTALHRHMSENRLANPSKVALMGGSYGGYMVLAGLAFYPAFWAAGIDIVGIANLVTFLQNTSAYRRSLREQEYGSLEHHSDLLWALSPIRKVSEIRSPLMIIHGANDPRVPLSEAELIYNTMTSLGKRAELVIYGDEGHGLRKLKNRLDAYEKVVDFLNETLR